MTPIGPDDMTRATRTACDYMTVLKHILPVMGVGGFVAFVMHLRQLTYAHTWARRIALCASIIGVGCVSGGVAVLGLSLFLPSPTVEFDLVAAAVAGSAGQKTFDIYGRRLFGWKTRSTDEEDTDE